MEWGDAGSQASSRNSLHGAQGLARRRHPEARFPGPRRRFNTKPDEQESAQKPVLGITSWGWQWEEGWDLEALVVSADASDSGPDWQLKFCLTMSKWVS